MPSSMRAISVSEPGDPDNLLLSELAIPRPGPDEVLIRVAAAGLNRADSLQRQGHYPPPPGASETLGMEVSGTISAIGAAVTRWKSGDRVCALLAGGGYAEFCVAPAVQCLPVAAMLSLTHAAGLSEAAFTVWANLFHQPLVRAGETLLIQGGASGIGTFAIQAAHALGILVATTAGSQAKLATCRDLGAALAVSYKEDWVAAVRAWARNSTNDKGVDCILDMIGGDYFPIHIDLLAPRGRLAHIAFAGGPQVQLDLRKLMQKQLVITGSTLRSRPAEEKGRLRDELEAKLWPAVLSGAIRPVIDRIFPLEAATQAHHYFDSGQHTGKVLLAIDPSEPQ